MDSAPQRDFSHWPWGIIRQIGGQDADPQLSLQENTQRHTDKSSRGWEVTEKLNSLLRSRMIISLQPKTLIIKIQTCVESHVLSQFKVQV